MVIDKGVGKRLLKDLLVIIRRIYCCTLARNINTNDELEQWFEKKEERVLNRIDIIDWRKRIKSLKIVPNPES